MVRCLLRSVAVFVDSMGGEVAGRFLPVTASRAVKGSIFGVVEGAFARSYRHFTARLRALSRIPGGDPLGVALEPASHRWSSSGFARFRVSGRALSAFVPAQRFPCGPLTLELEARAQIPQMRGRSGRQDVPERSVPSGLARRASGAHATTESGAEAETRGGQVGAQVAEPERASHSQATP